MLRILIVMTVLAGSLACAAVGRERLLANALAEADDVTLHGEIDVLERNHIIQTLGMLDMLDVGRILSITEIGANNAYVISTTGDLIDLHRDPDGAWSANTAIDIFSDSIVLMEDGTVGLQGQSFHGNVAQ